MSSAQSRAHLVYRQQILARRRHVLPIPLEPRAPLKDCQWLQKLHSCGLLRGAFRPPEEFNAVRSVIRESENVRQMRTQSIQSIQKSLDQMNVRVRHAVSDIDGFTGMRILAAIVGGERDPRVLAKLRDKRCRKSEAEIAEELTGNWRDEHLFNLKQAYDTLCFLDERIADYDRQVRDMYAKIASTHSPPSPTSSLTSASRLRWGRARARTSVRARSTRTRHGSDSS